MAESSRSSFENVSAQGTHPTWVRWVMPSVADLIFLCLLFTLTCTALSMRLLGDAGIGWHIRTGQIILATNSIPRTDFFSSSMNGKPWFAWEWLYDSVVGWLDARAGLNGVIWFTAVVIASVFAALFRRLVRTGSHLVDALALLLLSIAASMIHFLARPHILSWFFAVAWFWILDSSECAGDKGRRRLWLLPVLMLIWVNVHGGFLLGFVLLAIFLGASLWKWQHSREDRIEDAFQKIAAAERARKLTLAVLLSALASLVNPYGWKLYAHIYLYLTNRFLMDHIGEFQSPKFHGSAEKCFLAVLVITMAVLAARGREIRISGILTILFAVCSGLYSARNIPVAAMLMVLIIGPKVPLEDWGGEFFARMERLELSLRGHAWPVLGTIFAFAVALNHGSVGTLQLMDAHFNPKRMPVAAVDYLAERDLHGPVLTQDSWGGYVIYRLYPKTHVVLDDRHDFYGAVFFESYWKMMEGERGWEQFLTQHHPGVVLLPQETALANLLRESGGWKIVYSDDLSIIFSPASSGSDDFDNSLSKERRAPTGN